MDLLIGKGGQGLNTGPKKKLGMLVYVQDAMERHHPGLPLQEWSVEMVREICDEMIQQAKSDVLL